MYAEVETDLIDCLDTALRPYSFQRLERFDLSQGPQIEAAWRRKNWNTNRGVAIVSMASGSSHVGEFARAVAKPVGKRIGYLPFWNPLGLQLIVTGKSILASTDGLDAYVSKANNFSIVLQSIHVVDYEKMASVSVRTWGQYVSGRFQDAIEKGIARFLTLERQN